MVSILDQKLNELRIYVYNMHNEIDRLINDDPHSEVSAEWLEMKLSEITLKIDILCGVINEPYEYDSN